jgi:hypothetical protein
MVDVTDAANPENLSALTPKVMHNGGAFGAILQPDEQVELTNNAPIATGATSTTPFGTATADQFDDLLATVIQIRAGLITLGLFKDGTANSD